MNRKLFCDWFESPQGKILLQNEVCFLKSAITLGCKQNILQLGSLGWEDQFIDCSLYRSFIVVDKCQYSCPDCVKINANINELPIASDSVDMVILPHILEFEKNQFHILREAERVLKAEGQLLIFGFNPWSLFSLYQTMIRSPEKAPCKGHYISRFRMIDRLHLMNFEAEVAAGFDLKTVITQSIDFKKTRRSFTVAAYAIKAIKRRFNIIPLQPVTVSKPRFAVIGSVESSE